MRQSRPWNRARGNVRGFTLIEVLIVIVIVLALGGLVAYNLLGTKERAEADIAKIEMNTIKQALRQFRFIHSRYPTDEEGLRVLWDKEAMTDETELSKWQALLESPMPKDRWGSDWGYRQKSEQGDENMYDLWSFGPDKQDGTEDDITSWAKEGEEGATGGGGGGESSGAGGS